jgi:hypothetical protein
MHCIEINICADNNGGNGNKCNEFIKIMAQEIKQTNSSSP